MKDIKAILVKCEAWDSLVKDLEKDSNNGTMGQAQAYLSAKIAQGSAYKELAMTLLDVGYVEEKKAA